LNVSVEASGLWVQQLIHILLLRQQLNTSTHTLCPLFSSWTYRHARPIHISNWTYRHARPIHISNWTYWHTHPAPCSATEHTDTHILSLVQ
jgi:hypothetical protein